MTINEMEKILNISRANIRYYEKEGFISPKRHSNGYREYTSDDVSKLKRVIIFRKIGLSITDIKSITNCETSLTDAINSNISNLESQISDLNGSLNLSKKIIKDDTDIEDFDQEKYFNLIYNEESNGNKFNDIVNDCADFEKNIFSKMWENVFLLDYSKIKEKHGILKTLIIIFAICIVRGLAKQFIWHSGTFWEGFFYPFIIFAFASLILLPVFLLSRKNEKAGNVVSTTITIIGVLLLAVVVGILIIGLILSVFS